ncbi:MAG: phosphate/phosphite/phosphonate ABC transporter substrate-binding protein [Candidatus Marinimicrobia bacterium]|nr:phosphate/phosphite/phosphonate ABC transporter substrate-binding protein [Candidatus Neomarinimicrobiota bacterium]
MLSYVKLTDMEVLPDIDQNFVKGEIDDDKEWVYFGVISRYSPHILYKGYQPIMDYLNEVTPYHFELRLSSSYDETVQQLDNGNVDIAFLGSYIYARDRKKYKLKCIMKPLNTEGKPTSRSVLITTDSSSNYSLMDLKNKSLALPSTESFSANWLSHVEFSRNNLKTDDFKRIEYFSFHQNVIEQVLMGHFDAGVVKERVVQDYINKGIRIIQLSDPIPGSPIVVSNKSDKMMMKEVMEAFLKIDPSQKKDSLLLADWDLEFHYGFTSALDSEYDNLELMVRETK